MGNLTINNGGIITNSNNLPNIDLRYGPYNSLDSAYGSLGQSLVPGLVIGVIRDDGKITEYQAQRGGGNIELVPRSVIISYEDLDDLPEITDGTNNAELKGTIEVSATSGNVAGVNIDTNTPGTIGLEFTLPKGAAGQNGAPGHNPCLGRYDTLPAVADLPEIPRVGDYLYVDDKTDPTNVVTTLYKYDATSQTGFDQGTLISVDDAIFNSGEYVRNIKIAHTSSQSDILVPLGMFNSLNNAAFDAISAIYDILHKTAYHENVDVEILKIQTALENFSVPLITLNIIGDSNIINNKYQFSASYNPVNTTEKLVSWSIVQGSNYATINANTGLLTVLSGTTSETITIRATSSFNTAIYADKTIVVTNPYLIEVENVARTKNLSTGFDPVAEDNYMIMAYRSSLANYVQQFATDFITTGGGFSVFGLYRPTTDTFHGDFGIQSITDSTSSTKVTVVSRSNIKAVVIKKENGIYSWTINGTEWTSFNSYYNNGENSAEVLLLMGRTDRFTNDKYGFYIVSLINQQIVTEFFNEHNK